MKLQAHYPIKYGFDNSSAPCLPVLDTEKSSFKTSFDKKLWMFHRYWEPPQDIEVHATLMILHGTVDHSGTYAELAQDLANAGIAVFAMDMRGWGLSDGESMYIDNMDTFTADVNNLYQHVHSIPRYKAITSRFLLGKSLGGTVSAFCIAKYPQHWRGLLGLSGAYQIDPKLTPSPLIVPLLRMLAKFFPKLPLKPLFDEHLIVADENALQAWREDPLCCKDKLRLGYIVNLLECLKVLPHLVKSHLNIPMLMMCGDADKIVTLSGHELMIQENQHSDKQLNIYPNGLHNMLQEPALKSRVMADIQEWILRISKAKRTEK
jgi:acylglycerol lipase